MDRYIGKLLDNRYEILEVIGTGGMAVVYKARCHRLNRNVAVKLLKDEHVKDAEFRRRFHDESQAVAMLSHPNIVSVYDVSSTGDNEYIVMELIDGITLKEYLKHKGALPWKEALYITIQIAKALAHAHSRGIIHRDIKPHNIMVCRDGTIKVADFGIARLMMQKKATLVQETLGSVHYIAPEQARGGYVDARADIYSLGVVLYEMLTGRLPFEGDTPVAVAMQHMTAVAVSPRDLVPSLPASIETVTMKAMNPDLDVRYASAEQMLADLEKVKTNPDIVFDYDLEAVRGRSKDADPFGSTQKIRNVHAVSKRQAAEKAAARKGGRRPAREEQGYDDYDEDERKGGAARVATTVIITLLTVGVFIGGIVFFAWSLIDPSKGGGGTEADRAPNLVGMMLADIELDNELNEKYDIRVAERVYSETEPEGKVLDQSPKADRKLGEGGVIELTVSSGQKAFQLIDYSNLEYRQVETELQRLGLLFRETHEQSDTVLKDYVIRTEPAEGTPVREGDVITVVISLGKNVEKVKVPNILGQSEEKARKMITDAGMEPGNVTQSESDEPAGTVIRQNIAADTEVNEKTALDFEVSSGPAAPDEPGTGTPDDPDGNGGGTQPPDQPDDNEPKYATLTYVFPADSSGDLEITVKLNGKEVHAQTYKASDKQMSLTFKGTGSAFAAVYVNGKLAAEKILTFE